MERAGKARSHLTTEFSVAVTLSLPMMGLCTFVPCLYCYVHLLGQADGKFFFFSSSGITLLHIQYLMSEPELKYLSRIQNAEESGEKHLYSSHVSVKQQALQLFLN